MPHRELTLSNRSANTLVCRFKLPIRLGDAQEQYIQVAGVFRKLPEDQLGVWLMHPDGLPRSDRELAREVLLELRRTYDEWSELSTPLKIDLAEVTAFEKAAAVIVAAFLAALPRLSHEVRPVRRRRHQPQIMRGSPTEHSD